MIKINKVNYIYNNQSKKIEWLIFFCLFIYSLLMLMPISFPSQTTGADEMGTVAGAAFFAGHNWSSVISSTGTGYYGFGYSMLMSPIFILAKSGLICFQFFLLYNALLFSLSGVLCYKIITDYLGVEKRSEAFLFAIASITCYFFASDINVLLNESMLTFLIWLILYLLLVMLSNIDNRKQILKYTIILSALIFYSFLVHTRAVVILFGVIVACVGCGIFYKKYLVNIPVFILLIISGFLIANQIIHTVQSDIWMQDVNGLNNSNEQVFHGILSQLLGNFSSWENVYGLFISSAGKLFSIIVISAGVGVLGIVSCFVILFSNKSAKHIRKNKISRNIELNKNFNISALYIFIPFVCIWLLVGVVTMSQTASIAVSGEMANKWFTYTRYHGLFVGPLIMIAFCFLYSFKEFRKKIILTSALIFSGISIIFLCATYGRYASVAVSGSGEYFKYLGFLLKKGSDVFSNESFIIIGLIGAGLLTIISLLLIKSKMKIASIIVIGVSLYLTIYSSVVVIYPDSESNLQQAIIVNKTFLNTNGQGKLPDTIYYIGDNSLNALFIQYILYGKHIIYINPYHVGGQANNLDSLLATPNNIIITDGKICNDFLPISEAQNIFVTKINDKTYLYVTGEYLKHVFENKGLEFQPNADADANTTYFLGVR